MMGHTDVDLQCTYVVGVDENQQLGVERLGKQLSSIVQISGYNDLAN